MRMYALLGPGNCRENGARIHLLAMCSFTGVGNMNTEPEATMRYYMHRRELLKRNVKYMDRILKWQSWRKLAKGLPKVFKVTICTSRETDRIDLSLLEHKHLNVYGTPTPHKGSIKGWYMVDYMKWGRE